MLLNVNASSGVPIYLQLGEQIKHAIETGALKAGEQLPTIRKVAEDLAVNPNTVARTYRELESEGIIDVRHGSGAYVAASRVFSARAAALRRASEILSEAVERALALGLSEAELRRVFENGLAQTPRSGLPAGGRS